MGSWLWGLFGKREEIKNDFFPDKDLQVAKAYGNAVHRYYDQNATPTGSLGNHNEVYRNEGNNDFLNPLNPLSPFSPFSIYNNEPSHHDVESIQHNIGSGDTHTDTHYSSNDSYSSSDSYSSCDSSCDSSSGGGD